MWRCKKCGAEFKQSFVASFLAATQGGSGRCPNGKLHVFRKVKDE